MSESFQNTTIPVFSSNHASDMDLTPCDREEIRFMAAIMPHGAILVVDSNNFKPLAASVNLPALLDENASLTDTDSRNWLNHLPEALWNDLKKLQDNYLGRYQANGKILDTCAVKSGNTFIIEFELLNDDIEFNSFRSLTDLADSLAALQRCASVEELNQVVVDELFKLSGFDTVLLMTMNRDETSQAVAEAKNDAFPSYLDKRFPKSDIPAPARKKLLSIPLVYAPDITYTPIAVEAIDKAFKTEELDLSDCKFRHLLQACNEFYLNVGIQAKLVLPLVRDGRLWAYVVHWSEKPKTISATRRKQIRMFLDIAGQLIVEKKLAHEKQTLISIGNQLDDFLEETESQMDVDAGINLLPGLLMQQLDCCGAVCFYGGKYYKQGLCPDDRSLGIISSRISTLLNANRENGLVAVDHQGETKIISGILGLPLIETGSFVAVFRQQMIDEVTWAGDPRKPVIENPSNGDIRLTARGSFEDWKEEVKHQAKPWGFVDIHIFQRLINGFSRQQARKQTLLSSQSKARYLAEISHELRSPLNAVSGITQNIKKRVGQPASSQDIEQLSLSVDHLLNIVNGVLDLSKLDAGKMTLEEITFDLHQTIANSLKIVSWMAESKGLELKSAASNLPVNVKGDPTRLSQMLIHYLNNAIKFTNVGSVTITGEIIETDDQKIKLRIGVKDTGDGISQENLEKLFSAFQQADKTITRQSGGTGLGLIITKQLAEMMGGSAGVESQKGQGSYFWFECWLQIANPDELNTLSTHQKSAFQCLKESDKKLRVLIVDDEFFNVAITENLLHDVGIHTDAVSSGKEAINSIHTGNYDLALLDMHLDDMTGVDITKLVRENKSFDKIGLIALTGETRQEFRNACKEAGMDGYLLKPIQESEFYKSLLEFHNRLFA